MERFVDLLSAAQWTNTMSGTLRINMPRQRNFNIGLMKFVLRACNDVTRNPKFVRMLRCPLPENPHLRLVNSGFPAPRALPPAEFRIPALHLIGVLGGKISASRHSARKSPNSIPLCITFLQTPALRRSNSASEPFLRKFQTPAPRRRAGVTQERA